jgi:hypothetical protein
MVATQLECFIANKKKSQKFNLINLVRGLDLYFIAESL